MAGLSRCGGSGALQETYGHPGRLTCVGGIGVSADLLAEALSDGSAPNHDFYFIPDTFFHRQVYDPAHFRHGGGKQGRAGYNTAVLFDSGVNKGLGTHVHAQINDLQAAAFHHYLYQVLAYIVHVPLHRAQDHPACGFLFAAYKTRL